MQRVLTVIAVALVMAAMLVAMSMSAFADPNCTGSKADRPGSCHETGQPGPSNFVAGGGGALAPNH
jgi:hypothetical protein